jgi:hypothetical protein
MKNAPAPSSGDELTGQKLLDLWAAVHELQDKGITSAQPPLVRVGETLMFEESEFVLVRNDSGSDCQATDVLGIDDSVVDPTSGADPPPAFLQGITLKGITPATPDHLGGKFVICAEPIKSNAVGKAWAAGLCIAYLDVQDTTDLYAEIQDGESSALTTGASGSARIVWMDGSDTGEQYAIIQLGLHSPLIMQAQSDSDGDTVDVLPIDTDGNTVGDTNSTVKVLSSDVCGTKIYADDLVSTVEAADGTPLAVPIFGTSDNATELDSGTDDSANTDDWDITDQTSGAPGVIFIPIRLAWSGTPGDPVHQYTRKMTFDSQGRLVKVAAEEQSDAFATGPCGDSGGD